MSRLELAPTLVRIRITSGEQRGFYVGPRLLPPLARPLAEADQALRLNGFDYMLYTLPAAATCFGSALARKVQADLKNLGIDSELI